MQSSSTTVHLRAVKIIIAKDLSLILTEKNYRPNSDKENFIELEKGKIFGVRVSSNKSCILYDSLAEIRGIQKLVLYETERYYWYLEYNKQTYLSLTIKSSLDGKAEWNIRELNGISGDFYVISYLGSVWFEIKALHTSQRIYFDIISKKIDFETEYRAMVEAIAEKCQLYR